MKTDRSIILIFYQNDKLLTGLLTEANDFEDTKLKKYREEIKSLRNERNGIETQINNYLNVIKKFGDSSDCETILQDMNKLNVRKKELAKNIEEIQTMASEIKIKKFDPKVIKHHFNNFTSCFLKLDLVKKNELMCLLINRIVIGEKEIKIEFWNQILDKKKKNSANSGISVNHSYQSLHKSSEMLPE